MNRLVLAVLYFFVFSLPWEDMFVISGFGAVSKLFGLLFLLISMIYILYRGYISGINKQHIIIFIFCVWGACSYFWSHNKLSSLTVILTLIQLCLMFVLMSQVIDTRKHILKMLQAFVFGGLVSSFGTIYNYVSGININVYDSRFAARGFDPNELGIILVMSIAISWYLSLYIENKFLIIINRIYIALGSFAVFLTASRTAFLALLIAYIYIFISGKKNSKLSWILKISIGSLILYNLHLFIPEASLDRILTTSSEIKSGDLNARQDAWAGGMRLFQDNPILGVGIGAFRTTLASNYNIDMVAHNIYISVLGELGIVGLIIFLCILVQGLLNIKSLKYNNKLLLIVLLLVWILASMTLTWEYSKTTWLFFVLLNICRKLDSKNEKKV
ncbi:O-antigen ligase family protein [Bacillus cereus]|uniref:O-antigen ligase family protein n=1 Tax=Bacillus cereus TaxID=1396 RepID=UPI00356CD365